MPALYTPTLSNEKDPGGLAVQHISVTEVYFGALISLLESTQASWGTHNPEDATLSSSAVPRSLAGWFSPC